MTSLLAAFNVFEIDILNFYLENVYAYALLKYLNSSIFLGARKKCIYVKVNKILTNEENVLLQTWE